MISAERPGPGKILSFISILFRASNSSSETFQPIRGFQISAGRGHLTLRRFDLWLGQEGVSVGRGVLRTCHFPWEIGDCFRQPFSLALKHLIPGLSVDKDTPPQ